MTDEIFDLLDADRNPTGETHRRGDPIPEGLFHVVVSVCVVKDDGYVLVTQRAATKSYPLKWELTAGSAVAGETSAEAASRELSEEVGINFDPEWLRPLGSIMEQTAFFDLYGVTVDFIAGVRLDPEEVADSRWVTLEELDTMTRNGEMADPWVQRLATFRPAIETYFTESLEAR